MDFILDHLAVGRARGAAVLHRHKVPIADMRPVPQGQLREAVQWVGGRMGGECVLVFCNAGVGRSPAVVVGYLR